MWFQERTRLGTDMSFTVHQLVKKSIEHRAKLLLLFVDLKKA